VYFILAPQPPFTLWYLLALLNSRPYFVWLFYQGKRKGRLLELYAQPLGQVPLAAPSKNVQNKLATLARRIYELKQQNPSADTRSLQQQIDRHVCRLFHFTTRETKAVLDTTYFEEK